MELMENRIGFFGVLRVLGSATVLVSSLFASSPAMAGRPLALVYNGPGSCKSDGQCAEAAAAVAEKAGFEVQFVGPSAKEAALLDQASVYIQPGGNATTVANSMTETLKNGIRDFVHAGGGYVGFCAGAFYAMTPYDADGSNRLGLLAGDAVVADFDYPSIQAVTWHDGSKHDVYWEGGAYFTLSRKSDVEVVSRYESTHQVAAVRGMSGQGRVFISGFHPEAPEAWRHDPELKDPDGVEADQDLAVEMIRWAGQVR